MPIRCPLEREIHGDKEPSQICLDQCEDIWLRDGVVLPYDRYQGSDVDCYRDTETSHTVLVSEGSNGERRYATVDYCDYHGEEVGQENTIFKCPYALIEGSLE